MTNQDRRFKKIGAYFKQGWQHKRIQAVWHFLRKYGLVIAIGLIGVYLVGDWLYAQSWTGFQSTPTTPAKTLWDWLDLLVVPIVLGVGALLFNRRAALRDKERDEATRQEEILQDYLDDMSQLLLEKELKLELKKRYSTPKPSFALRVETEPEEVSPVVDLARARTVSTLRRLKDSQRRNELLDFLRDAGLYKGDTPLLRRARMDGINLEKTNLREIDLSGSILVGASLDGADLSVANLELTDLTGANLERAKLIETYLVAAELSDTHLKRARLMFANLTGANLKSAHLEGVNLFDAHLESADLEGANLIGANLTETKLDQETRLPDGKLWKAGVDMTQFTKPKDKKEA